MVLQRRGCRRCQHRRVLCLVLLYHLAVAVHDGPVCSTTVLLLMQALECTRYAAGFHDCFAWWRRQGLASYATCCTGFQVCSVHAEPLSSVCFSKQMRDWISCTRCWYWHKLTGEYAHLVGPKQEMNAAFRQVSVCHEDLHHGVQGRRLQL